MKQFCRIFIQLLVLLVSSQLSSQLFAQTKGKVDWLVEPVPEKANVYLDSDKNEIVMQNGLICRAWKTKPNGACVRFDNLTTNESLIRGVKPEATIKVNEKLINIGGLIGQPNYAFILDEWLNSGELKAAPDSFKLASWNFGKTKERFPWKKVRYLSKTVADKPYPPAGVSLELIYKLPEDAAKTIIPGDDTAEVKLRDALENIEVCVYYEMYDGIPLMAKTIYIKNNSKDFPITLNKFESEILALVEGEHSVESRMKLDDAWKKQDESGKTAETTPFLPHTVLSPGVMTGSWLPKVHVESEYECVGMDAKSANEIVRWEPDPQFETQVNYERITPCLLKSGFVRFDYQIKPGETFESPWTFELVHDSYDRERCGLAQRRMYRTLAPWSVENPIIMHVSSVNEDAVKLAVDQCAELGFEMVILTFGSGFNIENESQENLEYIKKLTKYANDKGVELGGYSLLASRSEGEKNDVINPLTGKPGGFARFG
ncbi:MAG: hypothetical protein ACRC2T_03480, partial [Thermoguttaceae bacterium]